MLAEAPFEIFPVSWQDGGAGLPRWPRRWWRWAAAPPFGAAVHLVLLGLLCGVAALLIGVYFA